MTSFMSCVVTGAVCSVFITKRNNFLRVSGFAKLVFNKRKHLQKAGVNQHLAIPSATRFFSFFFVDNCKKN